MRLFGEEIYRESQVFYKDILILQNGFQLIEMIQKMRLMCLDANDNNLRFFFINILFSFQILEVDFNYKFYKLEFKQEV